MHQQLHSVVHAKSVESELQSHWSVVDKLYRNLSGHVNIDTHPVAHFTANNRIVLEFLVITFLARDVIYTSHAYATMSVSVCLSVCPSVCDGSALAHYG